METKKSLRQVVGSLLVAQSPPDRQRRSLAIQKKLWRELAFQEAGLVFFYVSRSEEVDTHLMIDQALASGKRVAVPSSDLKSKKLIFSEIHDRRKDLILGAYEILEPDPAKTTPVSFKEAGCVLVPGVIFDRKNNRIGHGAGFYDRFLKQIDPQVAKIGLAFSFQVLDEIPYEDHDVALDLVITD